jgi:hypothetical protein
MKLNHSSFIRKNLGPSEDVDHENLKNEYLKLKEENEKLRQRITDLTKQVCINIR